MQNNTRLNQQLYQQGKSWLSFREVPTTDHPVWIKGQTWTGWLWNLENM